MGISFNTFRGSKDGSIVSHTLNQPDLTGDQVHVKVTASGLCGTDAHYRSVDMALGHEGAGVVEATGPGVRSLKKGDRVGWGYQHDSCGQCQQCLQGHETYCPDRHMYGSQELDQGSFAEAAVWREAFLFKIPDSLKDEEAAPLMCGGATVFNALHMYNVQPTDTVGIIGVGGLGHLAIQFASKMGTNVVVFSGTDSKKEEATKLGADSFHATKGVKELKIPEKLNMLLVTTSFQPDWNIYLPLMAPGGKIFPLSVSDGNLELPYMSLLGQGLTIQGSIVAPRYIHHRMLAFAAHHGIKPMLNKFNLDKAGIEECFKTLDEGKMRYRGVLIPQKA